MVAIGIVLRSFFMFTFKCVRRGFKARRHRFDIVNKNVSLD